MARFQNHHIIHHGKQWESGNDTKWIRNNAGLIVRMDSDIHADLHKNSPGVPLIDIFMARRVKSILGRQALGTVIDNIDAFCWAIEDAVEHPRIYETERMVGFAAIDAVRMQLPYIKESLVLDEVA